MKILVINSGSSSIKYSLFDAGEQQALATGLVERIGEDSSRIKHQAVIDGKSRQLTRDLVIEDHRQGLKLVTELLLDDQIGVLASAADITAIGHRVVHGGERYSQPTVIDDDLIEAVRTLAPFAPLHNPPNLQGIEVASELFPDATQVAVFDTAFHQSMPAAAYRYAIPNYLYDDHGIRVYGFHGTSHLYVTKQASQYLGKPLDEINLITAHLGNGASITAVRGGKSVDTSMGFSPLAGLVMGTRSGDLDPAVLFFLGTKLAMSFPEIDRLLNKQSGMIGLTGNNDLRDIEDRQAEGDDQAQLALDVYTYRIKKYIGAYMAALGHVDAIVFTAGVGENSPYVRWHVCQGLEGLGVILDADKNDILAREITELQANDSPIKVLAIPTNEELEIARQTLEVLQENSG
ncbi:MAG: acetate kinase [Chloroflexota bacterium]|nr:acetate kinase [Chloroflexota bacterium]